MPIITTYQCEQCGRVDREPEGMRLIRVDKISLTTKSLNSTMKVMWCEDCASELNAHPGFVSARENHEKRDPLSAVPTKDSTVLRRILAAAKRTWKGD